MPGFKAYEKIVDQINPKQKSTGHVCFWDTREVVEIRDELYIAPITNGFDPDGYRLGLTQQGTQGQTKEVWLRECQRLIDSAVDGEYYDKCVSPEDEGVFRRPNPNPLFLKFYVLCKEEFKVHPTVQDGNVRVFTLSTRLDPFRRALVDVSFSTKFHFNGEYGELIFSFDQLGKAFESISQVVSCGK